MCCDNSRISCRRKNAKTSGETSQKGRIPALCSGIPEITEQGKLFLENGKPDGAIRDLERDINMNPTNGQNYYYLSEAWFLNGNISQAQEFNRLADLYLKGEPEWGHKVMRQMEQIKRAGK